MKNSTKALLAVIGVILLIIIVLVSSVISSYNKMVTARENVDTLMADLDVVLQRRADLIPNLVNTVKGAAAHETEIIDSVTSARANLLGASGVSEKAEANAELSKAINALMVIVENYPTISTSANYTQLSDELAGTENRIATARRDYNNAVKEYNSLIIKFPNNMLAGMFGMEKAEYFEASEGSTEVPTVDFD